jgi:two-component system, NtrC family, response regulator HydG
MASEQATVLAVDDDREMVNMIGDVLRGAGYRALSANSGAEALALVEQEQPDLLISDLKMAGMSGHRLQGELKRIAPNLPVIIITAFGSIQTAVESMKLGAFDYITKPFSNEELKLAVARALDDLQLRREVHRLRGELARRYGLDNIIASNPKMIELRQMLEQVADAPASVLITGESGTGKELFARTLHFQSRRREAPFVPVNCAAIPEALLESELFGYVRGAFTDARQSKSGLFQSARNGTLFLDEIGQMPLALQAKLLRVIEDKMVRPLGATEETPVDVRIVAATNSDLEKEIGDGRFRSDLYYRIATVHLTIPPLRERPEDLALLIGHFLARACAEAGRSLLRIDDEAMACLRRYSWPGNIRELQNAIQRAVILSRGDLIARADLPPKVAGYTAPSISMIDEAVARRLSVEQLEREYVRAVLESVGGNKSEAAAILGIDRKTLYRKLEDRPDESAEP